MPLKPTILLLTTLAATNAAAQAKYTATGPGSYIQAGLTVTAFQSDYGRSVVPTLTAFVDAHLYRRLGVELEARTAVLPHDGSTRETTYLAGPKLTIKPHAIRPFVKLLAGRGEFRFPNAVAQGSYFVAAPGAGLDWRLGESRWSARLLDLEYQVWPGFTFGALHPYAVSSGLTYRLK